MGIKNREEWLNEGHSYDQELENARNFKSSASELQQWAARKIAESRPENFKEGVIQPVQEANLYLADDVPMSDQNVFTVPIHQRTDNFTLRVFSDSPFPVSLTSMMWEGNYSPRYYTRT